MKEEISELKQKYEEIAGRDFSEEASEIHSEKSDENLLLETKSSEVPLFDTRLDEKKKEIKLIEPEVKEDVKPKLPDLTAESGSIISIPKFLSNKKKKILLFYLFTFSSK